MTEYFLGLIVFAFVGSVIFSLVPSGTSKRYVRLLCGLCSVGCIAFPIFELVAKGNGELEHVTELFETGNAVDNSVEIYNNCLNDASLKNAEEMLKSKIIKELSGNHNDIDVNISLGNNGDEFYIEHVVVYIYPSGYMLNPDKIYDVCENELGKTCDIVYK